MKVSIEEQRDIDRTTIDIKHRLDKEKQKLKSIDREVSVLDEVPCGDKFPQCKFILNAHKAKTSLRAKQRKIDELSDDLGAARKSLKKLQKKELETKLEKYNNLLDTLSETNVLKSKVKISLVEMKSKKEKTSEEMRLQEKSLNEMLSNVASSDAAEKLRSLRVKLRDLKNQEVAYEEKYQKVSEDVGLLHSEISSLIESKSAYDDLLEQWRVFDLFIQATSKNGVPLEIIRSRLPEINLEIASILQGTTGFTVELDSIEGSNDMNIYINYGDSKRIIECCSGMEKMMSAMAIRVALTNVSELSKPDILIIDEGFGSLDAGNIEACTTFLNSLKKWFRCILVISHVDAVKDSVDNVLEISKVGKDAKIIQK